MLWDATQETVGACQLPILNQNFPTPGQPVCQRPQTSLVLLLRQPWTFWPELHPGSHLPSHPEIFHLFRLFSLNTHSICISTYQFQLRFFCLPLLWLYTVGERICYCKSYKPHLTCPDYLVPTSTQSSYFWLLIGFTLLFQFLLISDYFPGTPDFPLFHGVCLHLLLTHTPEVFICYWWLSSSFSTWFCLRDFLISLPYQYSLSFIWL